MGPLGDLGYDVPSEDRTIDGPAGPIPVRIYSPQGAAGGDRPLVVFYHGVASASAISTPTTGSAGPSPSRSDHAAELGGDPRRMVVCGDSAGGNISAVVAQLARDEGRALALQALVYPATDVRDEASDLYPSYAENVEAPILDRPMLDYFKANSRTGGDEASPLMSPGLTEDLSGLAPALIVTAELDPLRDDGETYARRLQEAGVPVTLTRYDGMPHGFFSFGPVVDDAVKVVSEVAAAIAAVEPVGGA